jgi:hypothetical protein
MIQKNPESRPDCNDLIRVSTQELFKLEMNSTRKKNYLTQN